MTDLLDSVKRTVTDNLVRYALGRAISCQGCKSRVLDIGDSSLVTIRSATVQPMRVVHATSAVSLCRSCCDKAVERLPAHWLEIDRHSSWRPERYPKNRWISIVTTDGERKRIHVHVPSRGARGDWIIYRSGYPTDCWKVSNTICGRCIWFRTLGSARRFLSRAQRINSLNLDVGSDDYKKLHAIYLVCRDKETIGDGR